MRMRSQTENKSIRAFTLTEAAIVLGIMSIVLGGIWAAADSVYENRKILKTQEEVQVIVSGIRSIYAEKGYFDGTNSDLTSSLVTAGVFPAEMVRSDNLPYAPWGGRVTVFENGNLQFRIVLAISAANASFCPNTLRRIVGGGMDTGLVGIQGPGGHKSITAASIPTTTEIIALCRTGVATDVQLYFSLKG